MRLRTLIRLTPYVLVVLCVPLSAFAATLVTEDITSDTHWTLDGSPYVVNFDSNTFSPHFLTVASNVTLTIDPGVVVKFGSYNGMRVSGTLHAEGTAEDQIIFTSLQDDTAGGDTNGDGVATTPTDEEWLHLEFWNSSNGLFDYTTVRYGGEHVTPVPFTGIMNRGGTLVVNHTALVHNGYDGFGQEAGHTTITNSLISDQAIGIRMTGGDLEVSDTRIYNNTTSGIDHAWDGVLTVTHSEIDHNGTGITVEGQGAVTVSNSSIHGNAVLGIDNQTQITGYDEFDNPYIIDPGISIAAQNNWWGDQSGPHDPEHNTAGTGNGVSGGVVYTPWLTSDPFTLADPCVATNTCVSNVMFLPGIEGSRLYRPDYNGGTDQLWEPNIDADVRDLYMNPDGTSTRVDVYARTGDILDELPNGENIYKSFIAKMNALRDTQHLINDWEPIAYDWRLSLDDILNYGNDINGRVYYSGDLRATSTPYIIQELRHLAATSKTGKVTIVAHSNGGLLAKRLTELLGSTESSNLIDKMIFIAVPQVGTPMAIPADLHGYKQDHVMGLVTSNSTARTLASASPMAYNLLPSAQYFTYVDDPVVTFDSTLPDWTSRYGSVIHSQSSLHQFLTDTYGRTDSQTGDFNQPTQLSNSLLSAAETLHATLDNWAPPTGVQLTQIAGWGIPKTVNGVIYKKNGTGVQLEPDFTIDGDGTVVVPSALWTSIAEGAMNYFVNLATWNSRFANTATFGLLGAEHGNIFEVPSLTQFVSDQIINIAKPLTNYAYFSMQSPIGGSRLRYALHSPLTLNLYDNEGRHTGISTSTGQIEEQIPGTYYTEFGDVKYLFSDASTTAHVVMNGYAPGTFTFNVDQYSGDTLTASTTFKDIPTTPSSVVSLGIQSDISTLSSMIVDQNGDGTIDATLTPKLNGTVFLDTTPPEAKVTFSTSTKKIFFTGSDESSSTTLKTSATSTIVTDLAGNTLTLKISQNISQANYASLTIPSFTYSTGSTTNTTTSLRYFWKTDKKNKYTLFISAIRTPTERLVSLYIPLTNKTYLFQSLPTDDTADLSKMTLQLLLRKVVKQVSGMVVPYISTQKGSSIIGY